MSYQGTTASRVILSVSEESRSAEVVVLARFLYVGVCSPSYRKIAIVAFSFLFLFSFVESVDNFAFGREGILPARPCGKIGREAEALRFGAIEKPVAKIDPASRSRGSREDRTLSWAFGARITQEGSGDRITLSRESIA